MDFMESSMACFTAEASKLCLLIAARFSSKGRLPTQSTTPAAAFMARCPVNLTAACTVERHRLWECSSGLLPELIDMTCTDVLSQKHQTRLRSG